MSAYDDWRCTDPGVEACCPDCGLPAEGWDADDDVCTCDLPEPDYEALTL